MTDLFGALVGPENVNAAVLQTLRVWLDTLLSAVELKNTPANTTRLRLPRPPAPDSYKGGLDFLNWIEEQLPSIIVVAQPQGQPERTGSAGYGQWFGVQIAAVLVGSDEDEARVRASHYGAAIEGAITQNGSLGGFASRTVMVQSPTVEFAVDAETSRNVMRAVVGFQTFVEPIVNEQLGPASPDPVSSPYYPGDPDQPWPAFPTVQETDVTVTAEPVDNGS